MAKTHYPVDAALVMLELSRADRQLARVIRRIGSFPTKRRKPQHPFASLLQAIVYQQIAGKAAEAIFGRVKALGANGFPTPEEILRASKAKNCRGERLGGKDARWDCPDACQDSPDE
jgi:3-methyladenine DNA glycosylase/8-oxoguanine DNA glycosylase